MQQLDGEIELKARVPYWLKPIIEKDHTDQRRFWVTKGLGSGGTYSAAIWHLLMCQINFESPQSWAIAPTYHQVADTLLPTFGEVAQKMFGWEEGSQYRLLLSGRPRMELLETGQTIFFKTANRPDRLVGPSVSHITGTEPGLWERVAYEKSSARLRCPKAVKRQYMLEGTPEGYNWYEKEANFGNDQRGGVDTARNYKRIVLWTEDNTYLPANYPDMLRDTYSYDSGKLESYLYGRFVPFTKGTAYWEFTSKNIKLDLQATHLLPVDLTWDFNISPLAWVACQQRWIDRPGGYRYKRFEALAESSGKAKGILDACVEFVIQFPPAQYRDTPIRIYGDPAGYSGHVLAPNCAYDQILQALRPYYSRIEIVANKPPAPLVKDRLERTNALFAYERLVVGAALNNTKRSFQQTSLKPGTWKIEKPGMEDWTHYGDAIGYYVMQESATTDLEPLSPKRRSGLNRPL